MPRIRELAGVGPVGVTRGLDLDRQEAAAGVDDVLALARNLWGALTAELAQQQATGFLVYAKVGEDVREDVRLTHLFPAEETDRHWRAGPPRHESARGLVWQQEPSLRADRVLAHAESPRDGTMVGQLEELGGSDRAKGAVLEQLADGDA